MSSAASTAQLEEEADLFRRPPQSLLRRILGETFIRWGARLGAGWLAALLGLSAFAPLIANTHPYLIKMDGQWSSPLLRHLSAADWAWLTGVFTAMLLWRVRVLPQMGRLLIWLLVVATVFVVAWVFFRPPQVVVYQKYRVAQLEARVDWALHAPIPYSPLDRMRDRQAITIAGPWWANDSHDHWAGQTADREDVASRIIHASRIALSVGFIATGISGLIGVVIGGFMGYFSGAVDLIGMRLVEIFEFIPQLFLLLMFVAFFERNIYMIMAIIGVTSWPGYARFIRAEFLKIRQQDYVAAARACGLPLRSILFRHMLPNGATPVLVRASFGFAGAILAEATLSFLGLGLVEEPSWGKMLNQATRHGSFVWWIAIFPGMAIFLTVFAYNLIGEAMRDAIDPHLKKSAQL